MRSWREGLRGLSLQRTHRTHRALTVASLLVCAAASITHAQPRPTGRVIQPGGTPPGQPLVEANPYGTHEEANPYTADTNPYAGEPAASDVPPALDGAASTGSSSASGEGAASAAASRWPTERVKFHALGIGFHTTTFATESGDGYSLSGPSVVYDYFVGRRFGFAMRGEAYFPMTGRMAGNGVDFRTSLLDAYETRRFGFDGMFMVAYRAPLGPKLVLTGAVGVHVQSFRLVDPRFNPVEAITGGFAVLGRFEYRLSPSFSVGGELALGLDPLDFVEHDNGARFTVPVTPSFFVGLTY